MKTNSLRAHDVLLACKLFSLAEARREWTYSSLATDLGLSAGEAHNSVGRCRGGGLLLPSREIARGPLHDLLSVAVPRIFFAERGAVARGLPTGAGAAPLAGRFEKSRHRGLPLVWAGAGSTRGETIAPVYPTAPAAARADATVYELLALVDVLRAGEPGERERAAELLTTRLLGGKT